MEPISAKTLQLAVETTGTSGSIAVLQGTQVLRQVQLPGDSRTASCMAPAIDNAMKWCGEQNYTLDFVSVAAGPGSFTGLRIGVTTAKTLCYATKLPLVAVDSVAAIAANVFSQHDHVAEVTIGTNAFRGQVFTGHFRRDELMDSPRVDRDADLVVNGSPVSVVDTPQWQAILQRVDQDGGYCAGDDKMFRSIAGDKSDGAQLLVRDQADAIGVGLLGLAGAQNGHWCEPISLVPRYLKLSAAEEKLA